MSRYALVFVGVMAVLLAGALPGVDGCALAAAPDHACCAEAAPEPTSSCCSSLEAETSGTEAGDQTGCDCIHPPSTPADMATSTASPAPNGATSLDLKTNDRFFGATLRQRGLTIERQVRIKPPPPVFLLDCSFLI